MTSDPRAEELRRRYLDAYGGVEIPVPVESIAEDLLGLQIERSWDIDFSGVLMPVERIIVLNAREAPGIRRRFGVSGSRSRTRWATGSVIASAECHSRSTAEPFTRTRTMESAASVRQIGSPRRF